MASPQSDSSASRDAWLHARTTGRHWRSLRRTRRDGRTALLRSMAKRGVTRRRCVCLRISLACAGRSSRTALVWNSERRMRAHGLTIRRRCVSQRRSCAVNCDRSSRSNLPTSTCENSSHRLNNRQRAPDGRASVNSSPTARKSTHASAHPARLAWILTSSLCRSRAITAWRMNSPVCRSAMCGGIAATLGPSPRRTRREGRCSTLSATARIRATPSWASPG